MDIEQLHQELTDAISFFEFEEIRRILVEMPMSELNAVPDNLTHLAYAVDVVEDAFLQSGVAESTEVIELLLAAGADPVRSSQRFPSAREIAARSEQPRLRSLFFA